MKTKPKGLNKLECAMRDSAVLNSYAEFGEKLRNLLDENLTMLQLEGASEIFFQA